MKKELQAIIKYLQSVTTDPFPRYIFKKEILQEAPTAADIEAIHASKWYKQLADEQWDDGSWGRFHTQDSKAPIKQKFVVTEMALRRIRELGISKDDSMVLKCVKLLERYVHGEETWSDWVEKHKDNGKSHMLWRPYVSAAQLNMFDPGNPVIQPLRNKLAAALKITSKYNFSFENILKQGTDEYIIAGIAAPALYSALLLQNSRCMSDELEKQYLEFLWNKVDGIYYVSSVPPAEKQHIESKLFLQWFSTLELLSGFSLFPDFMKGDIFPHLISEVNRIMNTDVEMPPAHPIFGHYAESWRDKSARKNDMILRILRILIKS